MIIKHDGIKTVDTLYVGGNERDGYFFELSRGPILVAVSRTSYKTRELATLAASESCQANDIGTPEIASSTEASIAIEMSNVIAAASAKTAGYRFTHINAEGYACYGEA